MQYVEILLKLRVKFRWHFPQDSRSPAVDYERYICWYFNQPTRWYLNSSFVSFIYFSVAVDIATCMNEITYRQKKKKTTTNKKF